MSMAIDNQTLMAFADGELDPVRTAEVDAAIAADPALARRVTEHRALRLRAASAHAGVLEEAVPAALLAAVMAAAPRSTVAPFERPRRAFPAALPQWAAMAAILIVGVMVGFGVQGLRPAPLIGGPDSLTAQGELARALDQRLAAGPAGPQRIAVGLSFRSADAYCRTFQVARERAVSGIACRDADAWRVRLAMDGPATAGQGGDYRLAASALPAPVLRAVDGMIQGPALDAAGEARAKAAGWRVR